MAEDQRGYDSRMDIANRSRTAAREAKSYTAQEIAKANAYADQQAAKVGVDAATNAASLANTAENNAKAYAASLVPGAWTDYTPAWTAATTNPTLGDGTLTGRFLKLGRLVEFDIVLTFGSTTTAGSGTWVFGLPNTARDAQAMVSAVHQAGSPLYIGRLVSTTGLSLYRTDTAAALGSAANPMTASSRLRIAGRYESAS